MASRVLTRSLDTKSIELIIDLLRTGEEGEEKLGRHAQFAGRRAFGRTK